MVKFKPERIPEILGENLNPSFFFLNLNPSTSSRANSNDITTPIITWMTLIIIVIMIIMIIKVIR